MTKVKDKVVYHMNVMDEHGVLVDLTNAEVVIENPEHGVVQFRFNEPPNAVINRRVCKWCGCNISKSDLKCSGCGGPELGEGE